MGLGASRKNLCAPVDLTPVKDIRHAPAHHGIAASPTGETP
jgi:hypothetical protein